MTCLFITAVLLVSCLATLSTATLFQRGRRSAVPVATPADHLDRLKETQSRGILSKAIERNDVISWENKQFKCQVLNALYRNAKIKFPSMPSEALSPRLMEMLQNCSARDMRVDDLLNQPFMFPGTNWCGQGNVAENYHHLGIFNQTDACCREHDFCEDIIRPGRTKHNLINPYGTTRLHCKCDEALRQCFRKANSIVSNTVGYIFFSLLQTQCFDFDHPTSGCLLWRRGAVRLYCVKYQLEEEQPKKWQWFDQEPYL